MRHFASEIIMEHDGDDVVTKDKGMFVEDEVKEEEEEETQLPIRSNNNALIYEATLAQISKFRSSLLYESDSPEEAEKDVSPEVVEKDDSSSNTNIVPMLSNDSQSEHTPVENAATLKKLPSLTMPRTKSDLDRGRHLVGLEVREVRPHQQIIIDYRDASSEEENFGGQLLMRPLRIRYLLSDDTNNDAVLDTDAKNMSSVLENNNNNLQLLSSLIDTSFNRTVNLWSQALSLPPVMSNIFPTVKTCGGARIPKLHTKNGVEHADIVIYVSGDNTFCGGALMHSAVCDFDQNMRPLVANINICIKNIPTTAATALPDDHGVHPIPTQVLNEYDGYIATETARLLGASTSLFRHYQNPDTDAPYGSSEKHTSCVDGTRETISVPNIISEDVDSNSGRVYYEIRTPKVIEVVRNHFDCMTLTGARLEMKKGGLGCFGGFLDQRLFFGEQISGFQVVQAKNQGAAISPLTLALLEDSSWYVANYTVSTETPFGRGGGCQFASGVCAVDDVGAVQVSTHGKGFHCAEIGKTGCDVSHSFKAKCDLLHSVAMVSTLQSPTNQVCPMHIRGAIDCAGASDSFLALPGEVYGKSSKCFLTDEGQPMCLQGTCNEEKQSIDFYYEDEVFTCRHDGQIIDTKKGLRIECPRIAAVCPSLICPSNCAGRGVCDEDREGKHTCICDDPFDDTPGCWGS